MSYLHRGQTPAGNRFVPGSLPQSPSSTTHISEGIKAPHTNKPSGTPNSSGTPLGFVAPDQEMSKSAAATHHATHHATSTPMHHAAIANGGRIGRV
jgi:hypothetical protein